MDDVLYQMGRFVAEHPSVFLVPAMATASIGVYAFYQTYKTFTEERERREQEEKYKSMQLNLPFQ